MNTLLTARTFNEVVSDWEHGLEPYKSPLVRATTTTRRSFGNDSSRNGSTPLAALIKGFFSLKVRPSFLTKVIAVAVFWLFFACLPPLNTGDEKPNGYYVHNFLTDTVEYRIAEKETK